MRLPAFLRKPRWLSKDAATRRTAVEHDGESELLANLGRLAREDADPAVRIAALRRLADPGIAQGLAHDDTDANVRAQARALWLDLLTGTHASAPALAERLRLLKAQDEADLIEHIARRAREPELRSAALERVTRPALLIERAGDDPDAGIRLALVERIDDEAQLARIAERVRKSDKQLNRRARERIEALRIARGDEAAVEARARQLCEQLEQLVREPAHAEAEVEIATRWTVIEARIAEPLRARYAAAQRLLVASREPPAPTPAPVPALVEPVAPAEPVAVIEAEAEAPVEAPIEATEAASESDAAERVVAPLIAQARFAASLDEANAEREQQREQQRALLADLEPAVHTFEAAVEAGASADAHAAKARIDELRKQLSAVPRALAQRITTAETQYVELSRWQHWADNQRRSQLCEEIEALPASGLHPDAIATRVRDARAEWARLDTAEGRTATGGGMARRFHAACRATLAPTQAYFKKRQELRESHAQEITTLLERSVTTLGVEPGRNDLVVARREVAEALRRLDGVEPRERKALAQRLREHLTMIDTRIAAYDQDVERAKAALIAEAEALCQGELQRGTAATARELQQRWQRAGNGQRSRDQKQWNMFRAALDAAFARLDAARTERVAQDAAAREQAEALCLELETLADAPQPAERAVQARLRSAWDALHVADPALLRRFDNAQARLRDAVLRFERSRRHARFDAWLARYRLCRAAETSAQPAQVLQAQWQDAPTGEIASDLLATRFEAATSGGVSTEETTPDDTFRDVLVELEALAGIESPDEDRERRRARQIDRLSARMGGSAAAADTMQDVTALLARWSALGPVPAAALDARIERALAAALDALP